MGCAIGVALGLLLVTSDNAVLLLGSLLQSLAAVCLLGALGGVVSLLGMLLPVVVITLLGRCCKKAAALGSSGVYLTTFAVAAGSFLAVTFIWLRPSANGPIGRFGLVALVLLAAIVAEGGGIYLATRRPRAASEPVRPRIMFAGLAVLVGLCLLCLGILVPEQRSREPGGQPAAAQASTAPVVTPRGNVLLICIDALRADHLGASQYLRDTSPTLDGLAQEGVQFLSARSQAPWTLPSHATMFTGLYPTTHGVRYRENSRLGFLNASDRLGDDQLTLAEVLAARGMRSGGITNSVFVSAIFGLEQGFDMFRVNNHGSAAATVDQAMDWIHQGGEQPFFLFLHFIDVHDYWAPGEYREHWVSPEYNGRFRHERLEKHPIISNQLGPVSPADRDYIIARYDSALTYVDQELDRLLSWLRTTDRYDDTLVVVTADHGEEFWEHGGTGHGLTLYDEQLLVPLIIKPRRWDEAAPGARISNNVGVIDIMPTVLDLLGIARPEQLEGQSLRPCLGGAEPDSFRPLYARATGFFNSAMVVEKGTKLICNRIPPQCWLRPRMLVVSIRSFLRYRDDELFVLDHDPFERENLLPAQSQTGSRLSSLLLAHLQHARTGQTQAIDEATREQLRCLGYIP